MAPDGDQPDPSFGSIFRSYHFRLTSGQKNYSNKTDETQKQLKKRLAGAFLDPTRKPIPSAASAEFTHTPPSEAGPPTDPPTDEQGNDTKRLGRYPLILFQEGGADESYS